MPTVEEVEAPAEPEPDEPDDDDQPPAATDSDDVE
jgi:hypothetical protein